MIDVETMLIHCITMLQLVSNEHWTEAIHKTQEMPCSTCELQHWSYIMHKKVRWTMGLLCMLLVNNEHKGKSKQENGFLNQWWWPFCNACVFWEGTFGSYNGGGKKSSKKKKKKKKIL